MYWRHHSVSGSHLQAISVQATALALVQVQVLQPSPAGKVSPGA